MSRGFSPPPEPGVAACVARRRGQVRCAQNWYIPTNVSGLSDSKSCQRSRSVIVLSLGNRLAYCRRLALDLANIEFAQADILELASLGRWQAVAAKLGGDIPAGPEAPAGATQGPLYAYFPTSSFNLVHLCLGYQINPDALASFSVENLFNQQYSRYLDVAPSPGHGVNSTPLPFFSPGITIKRALTVRFSDLTLL